MYYALPIVEKWTFKFCAHFTAKSWSRNTLGNMSLQNVAARNRSFCTGRTTSRSNTSRWQEKEKKKTLRWQIVSCVLRNFVKKICLATKFSRCTNTKFYVTCCSNKILSRRQRFSHKFSSTKRFVPTRCCSDISPSMAGPLRQKGLKRRMINLQISLHKIIIYFSNLFFKLDIEPCKDNDDLFQ